MRIIAFSTLREFIDNHASAEEALLEWYRSAKAADWKNANEVKAYASTVSLLSHDRLCFNIKGNDYRLIVSANWQTRTIFIKFVGTHAEYDRIKADEVGDTRSNEQKYFRKKGT